MTSTGRFDLAVIGAGPGGYVAAIRAAQLGQKVAVIEEDRPGGVCLNWGCVPSKALLSGAELVENLRRHGETFGVAVDGVHLDYGKVIDHSRKSADRLCKGVQSLFKKNRIELVKGRGRLESPTQVQVSGESDRMVEASHLLLATGSRECVPPGLEVDGECLLTSREALESKRIPERLVVVGAGAVGIEFAYVYAMYGSKVTVVEMVEQMLPGADREVAAAVQREFRRKGIEVRLGTSFEAIEKTSGAVRVSVSREGVPEEIEADQVLAAIGRRPLSDDLGLGEVGVAVDQGGFVVVDRQLRTSVPTISAIGDLVGGALLAHKASEEGIAAVEYLAGVQRPALDHRRIPFCIYSQPQIAWIGLTEEEARSEYGDQLRVGRFPFTASGKAVASAHTAGFVKLLAESEGGEIGSAWR
jgi:dihydrolipoamide dehydrogenase